MVSVVEVLNLNMKIMAYSNYKNKFKNLGKREKPETKNDYIKYDKHSNTVSIVHYSVSINTIDNCYSL